MTSLQPWWWAALSVLLLPLWWHRQKRQRTAAELLATARFLPSSAPQQRRIWRWTDVLLLLARLLLLAALIAWLAVTVFPWRGDTVLLAPGLPADWVEREVAAAGMAHAERLVSELPPLDRLHRDEHEWRKDARILVLARTGTVPMPARPPRLAHAVTFRLAPAVPPAPLVYRVVVAAPAERLARWQALFKAFGSGGARYELVAAPDTRTALIVWDRADPPPPAWRAPHWWRAGAMAGQRVPAAGLPLAYADTPQGRVWTGMPWPPRDETQALALYAAWQALAMAPASYPLPALALAPTGGVKPAGGSRAAWWPWLLAGLLFTERLLAHARRS
ncbi:BatA domain-containing protein [Massilia sp. YMA4]|uniref:BatA domain-containing protein n=1 Tax=Massilia sp. YMA4 TaxID=1593482 RepID=UPI0015828C7F|nr:BatA domain-containing protein [Massilia sp. YMA4]